MSIYLSILAGVALSLVWSPFFHDVLMAQAINPPLISEQGQALASLQTFPSPEEAARSSLQILKSPGFFREEVGGSDRATHLGFQSVAEVAEATLGKPIKVINVRLGLIQADMDPIRLVSDPHMVIFPLYVQSAVRSSLTVSDPSKANAWLRTGRGLPVLIRKIEKLRQQQEQPGDTFYLVMNRGIGLRFLARKSSTNKMTLTPLDSFTFGTLVLKAEEERPAEEIIRDLSPVAKKLFEMFKRRKLSTGSTDH